MLDESPTQMLLPKPLDFETIRDEINKNFLGTKLYNIDRASFLPFQHSSKESQMLKIDALRGAASQLSLEQDKGVFDTVELSELAADLALKADRFIRDYEALETVRRNY